MLASAERVVGPAEEVPTTSAEQRISRSRAALNAFVSPWFVRRRPMALSMAYNGASVGGLVFSALWVVLIGGIGGQFPLEQRLIFGTGAASASIVWFFTLGFGGPLLAPFFKRL